MSPSEAALGRLGPVIEVSYLLAAVLFILGLKALSSPRSARRGMGLAALGMTMAVAGTLLDAQIISFEWILVGAVIGSAAGVVIALWTPMTAMPQRTAFSHAFGALAVALVGIAEYHSHHGQLDRVKMAAIGFEVMLGGLTFTGSMMAFAKLQEWLRGAPITYRGQNVLNLGLLGVMAALAVYLVVTPGAGAAFYVMVVLALLFGVLLVIPIGAADMPVVIALLNSYAGLAGAATGFALDNKILIIAGALDGASGFILSILMCRAMNRSIGNVLFGAFGKVQAAEGGAEAQRAQVAVRSASAAEAAAALGGSELVIVVPGYGLAVSQAQHEVKELAEVLGERGVEVRFAIHPVAGRMPGHMNVLLAEAGVPYDQLSDMNEINPEFRRADVALVIGANDVVNPAAKDDPKSPIFGMPILEADQARSVIVLKRSMAPGFAGIDNELFRRPNTTMVFGDARRTVQDMIAAVKSRTEAAA